KNTHQGPNCESGHSLNTTPAISCRCLADCRGESLIAESTRWPALVLQPTRLVSPTIIGKSIPDRSSRLQEHRRVSFWLLRAPTGQSWYCSPHGR
ncbi:unnamed protein product, partial [Staurois parvus]